MPPVMVNGPRILLILLFIDGNTFASLPSMTSSSIPETYTVWTTFQFSGVNNNCGITVMLPWPPVEISTAV